MGWLGRLIGRDPPRVPAGGRPFVSQGLAADGRVTWSVRVQMPGEEPTPWCKRLGPTFTSLPVADAYRAWIAGEAATFTYPTDRAA